ncbi:hypothetical protein COV17_02440 [Candidatus Woesearchaeota archaeon CG10_big_fil_rev_8_21_14_0_10_36_11]|nr:MAG: hypothetical protein COV17_02440 [Candidatus Woesearchaeota archaeon CG10_big_fil_rev_8_21_14_0_10_36_11]
MGLHIIGTSHIAAQSVREIEKAIEYEKPDIICVELDIQRASALFDEQKTKISIAQILQIGVKGYVFAKVGQYVQQKLGNTVGIAPGADMKTALEIARQKKIDVAFIDQPIQVTLKHFSKSLTWKEKMRFVIDFFKGIFAPKKQMKRLGMQEFDLRKVPQDKLILTMIEQVKERYPSVYKVLVEDRNKYMVKKIVVLLRKYPEKKLLAVVGAGHVSGMNELLLKVDVLK